MIVYTDLEGRIKSLSPSDDLIEVTINDDNNPLENFSDAKKCCYRIQVTDGIITMMTPYVDSRLLDHFDRVGSLSEENSECEFDLAQYISDLEERIEALENKE